MSDEQLFLRALSPEERKEVLESLKAGLNEAFAESRNAAWELAKYLFAANAGAAAGIFVLVRDQASDGNLVPAFFAFCAGVFFVGLAYFLGAVGFSTTAKGFEGDVLRVFNGSMSLTEMMANRQRRVKGWSNRLVPVFGLAAFLCLMAGGGLSIRPFLRHKLITPSSTATNVQSVVVAPVATDSTNATR